MAEGRFATSLACMDGRIQGPITAWIRANHGADHVDTITEPGMDKLVSSGSGLDPIRAKVGISINAHKSSLIVVSGHHDCAGNPVSEEEHVSQIRRGVEEVRSWNTGAEVLGVWVDGSWTVRPV